MKRTFITALAAMMLCTTAQAETTNTNADNAAIEAKAEGSKI